MGEPALGPGNGLFISIGICPTIDRNVFLRMRLKTTDFGRSHSGHCLILRATVQPHARYRRSAKIAALLGYRLSFVYGTKYAS